VEANRTKPCHDASVTVVYIDHRWTCWYVGDRAADERARDPVIASYYWSDLIEQPSAPAEAVTEQSILLPGYSRVWRVGQAPLEHPATIRAERSGIDVRDFIEISARGASRAFWCIWKSLGRLGNESRERHSLHESEALVQRPAERRRIEPNR
jgi:hypothetical protein